MSLTLGQDFCSVALESRQHLAELTALGLRPRAAGEPALWGFAGFPFYPAQDHAENHLEKASEAQNQALEYQIQERSSAAIQQN